MGPAAYAHNKQKVKMLACPWLGRTESLLTPLSLERPPESRLAADAPDTVLIATPPTAVLPLASPPALVDVLLFSAPTRFVALAMGGRGTVKPVPGLRLAADAPAVALAGRLAARPAPETDLEAGACRREGPPPAVSGCDGAMPGFGRLSVCGMGIWEAPAPGRAGVWRGTSRASWRAYRSGRTEEASILRCVRGESMTELESVS